MGLEDCWRRAREVRRRVLAKDMLTDAGAAMNDNGQREGRWERR